MVFRTNLALIALVLPIAAQSRAEIVNYTIDPTQSTLSATGTLSGNTPSAQTFGSNIIDYFGSISADRTANSIQFIGGSDIAADQQPVKQQPGLDGESGSALANYGWRAPNTFGTTYAAFRDVFLDLSSDPLTVQASGGFASDFQIIYSGGGVDWNSGFQWDHVDFTGRTLFNANPSSPSVVVANGIETLTLPVRFTTSFSTVTSFDSSIRLSGTLVATRPLSQPTVEWIKNGDGSWGDAANWSGEIPNGSAAIANFLGAITAPHTVTLDGDRTIAKLNFDNANKYTIAPGSGGALTIGTSTTDGQINLNAATDEISANLNVNGFTVVTIPQNGRLILSGGLAIHNALLALDGGGALDISGPQLHQTSDLEVDSGTLTLNSDAGAPPTANPPPEVGLTLDITSFSADASNALVKLNASQHFQDLFIDYVAPGQQGLDLNSTPTQYHALRTYTNGDGVPEYFADQINYGRQHPGEGIFDSGLHQNAAIGMKVSTDQFGNDVILIRSTRIGDLNLDSCVTISDFIDLASSFGGQGLWAQGDLNGDGVITISDFIDLAANFGGCYDGSEFPITAAQQQMLNDFAAANGVTLVPEPSVLWLLLLAVAIAVAVRPVPRASCPFPN